MKPTTEAWVELVRAREEIDELVLIADSIPVLVSYIDRNLRYKRVNRAYEQFFGLDRKNIVGRSVSEILGEFYETAKPYLERALSGEHITFESRYLKRDGSVRNVRLTYTPDRRPDRDAPGLIVLAQDVTEHRIAESALLDANVKLGAIIQAAPLPIVAFTSRGEVTLWNPAAERVFGWTAEEVLGKPLPFIPEEKLSEHQRMREQDLRGEGFTNRELRRRKKDGSPIDISVSTAALRTPNGSISGIMSLYVDITERKRTEHELRQSEAKFRALVEQSPMPTDSFNITSFGEKLQDFFEFN